MPIARVDILDTNTFQPTGQVKSVHDAWKDGDWIGTFNLWIVRGTKSCGSILYQQRSAHSLWAPGLLDVAAGGHYEPGETIKDGLREVREELGKTFEFQSLLPLGKKIYVADLDGRRLRYVVDVFIIRDDSLLEDFQIDRVELDGLFECPIDDLIKAHSDPSYSFVAQGIKITDSHPVKTNILVNKKSFPYNWDNYHFKMALLSKQYLGGERPLLY